MIMKSFVENSRLLYGSYANCHDALMMINVQGYCEGKSGKNKNLYLLDQATILMENLELVC